MSPQRGSPAGPGVQGVTFSIHHGRALQPSTPTQQEAAGQPCCVVAHVPPSSGLFHVSWHSHSVEDGGSAEGGEDGSLGDEGGEGSEGGGRDGGEGGDGGDGGAGGSGIDGGGDGDGGSGEGGGGVAGGDGGVTGRSGDGVVSRYAPLRQSLPVLQLPWADVGHPPWATPLPAPWSHWP